MKIAIQGELGSFSHEAAQALVPDGEIVPFSFSTDLFAALSRNEVDAAVIPIENSLAGSVSEHFDLLLDHDVAIEKERLLRIRHNLIGNPGTSVAEMRSVYSHPVALAQCLQLFVKHPQMAAVPYYDTAGSVKQLVELRDAHVGAIASEQAAKFYGAEVLIAGVEDNPANFTRFFLIRKRSLSKPVTGANKLSVAFRLENRPGSLVAALQGLSSTGVNLTKIESRPVHGKPWEYVFFADCQLRSPNEADSAIAALTPHCFMVKELGRYQEANYA